MTPFYTIWSRITQFSFSQKLWVFNFNIFLSLFLFLLSYAWTLYKCHLNVLHIGTWLCHKFPSLLGVNSVCLTDTMNIVAQSFPSITFLSLQHPVTLKTTSRLWGHKHFSKRLHQWESEEAHPTHFSLGDALSLMEGCALLCTTYNFHILYNTSKPQIFWL